MSKSLKLLPTKDSSTNGFVTKVMVLRPLVAARAGLRELDGAAVEIIFIKNYLCVVIGFNLVDDVGHSLCPEARLA